MVRKGPLICGAVLASIHFLLIGLPFIVSRGEGEGLILVIFVDFPLFYLANIAMPKLLWNSVTFNFFWFVVLGTMMYLLIGYGICRLFTRAKDESNSET